MFTIGIVAHTSRAEQAHILMETVGAAYMSVDSGKLGCDDNHKKVQTYLAGIPSTWSVILEDDAHPVQDFREQLHQALVMAPTPIVSLYAGRKKPSHWQGRYKKALANAKTVDASWLISTHLLHAVGYAIRTEHLPSLLAHTSPHPSDQHITSWAQRYGYTVGYTIPSLIDHLDGPTIVDHADGAVRHPGRKAWTVGRRDRWTTEAVTMP